VGSTDYTQLAQAEFGGSVGTTPLNGPIRVASNGTDAYGCTAGGHLQPLTGAIAVVDREAGKQVGNWPMSAGAANFPMALDAEAGRVLVMFRSPARLGVFAMQDGAQVAVMESCGDADDLFLDAKRHRIYVSCGEGAIDVVDAQAYRRVTRIPTVAGARTSFFAPELDRFMLAVRAAAKEPAAIWLYRPTP